MTVNDTANSVPGTVQAGVRISVYVEWRYFLKAGPPSMVVVVVRLRTLASRS